MVISCKLHLTLWRSLHVGLEGLVEEFGDGDVVFGLFLEELGHTHIVLIVLQELNHQHVVVLVDRHIVLNGVGSSQELGD